MGKIKTRGTANGKAVPDRCKYTFEVNENGNTVGEATKKVTKTCELFLNSISKVIPDLSNIKYDRDSSAHLNVSGKSSCYARRYLKADLPLDMHLHSRIESAVAKADINVAIDTSPYYSGEEALRQQLLGEAVKNSRKAAEIIAKSQGQKITGMDKVNMDDKDIFDGWETFENVYRWLPGDVGCADLLSDQLTAEEITFTEYVDVIWNCESDRDNQ